MKIELHLEIWETYVWTYEGQTFSYIYDMPATEKYFLKNV